MTDRTSDPGTGDDKVVGPEGGSTGRRPPWSKVLVVILVALVVLLFIALHVAGIVPQH